MLIIGSHVSFNRDTQLLGSLKEALGYGENTFMFYTGAPQNTKRYEINDNLTNQALEKMKDNNIDINNIIVHAPYIINLANDKENDKYDFSISFLVLSDNVFLASLVPVLAAQVVPFCKPLVKSPAPKVDNIEAVV